MIALFLDCETSGLYHDEWLPDDPRQPWIVHVAAELYGSDGLLAVFADGVRADGRSIPETAARIHGIDSGLAGRTGGHELTALANLCGKSGLVGRATHVIGHGIDFDRKVIIASLCRMKRPANMMERPGRQFIDTMKAATPFCRLPQVNGPGNSQFKWPSLDEACELLLGEPRRSDRATAGMTATEIALANLGRTRRLFSWLHSRGAIAEAA